MPNAVDLTLGKLRHGTNLSDSKFLDLYERLVRADSLDESEYVDVLRFAILLLRSDDEIVARLGYRIILQYAELTHDYEPLHAVAKARDLIPIVAAAERLNPDLQVPQDLSALLFEAHRSNFQTEETNGQIVTRTRGQMELRSFNARTSNAIVVAPTSYGKSEMLIEKVVSRLNRSTCVVVPTRALISQTRALIVADPRVRDARVRVLTHPDAYTGEQAFIAVLTQERLGRLLVDWPTLELDQLLVDEAHNLLPNDTRALELSMVLLAARARNSDVSVTYYTPFMSNPSSLKHVHNADQFTESRSINEHVKSERIVQVRLGSRQRLYDQYLNKFIELNDESPDHEIDAVIAASGQRTLVYVNRPKDAQDLAARLSERRDPTELSPEALRAIAAIADLIDPGYGLINAIRAGVLFHHGQVPDILRQYIEQLFRADRATEKRWLVTTSTLLEGVNTPADCLVLMSPSRGRSHLTRSAFRNLIGRVARFREVFDPNRDDLDLLQPRIYLLHSSYASKNWNVENFLTNVANLSKSIEDDVLNPLLEASGESAERQSALEFLENVEPGSSGLISPRQATTEVGQLSFKNGVRDFDIFENETTIQQRVDRAREEPPFTAPEQVILAICDIFLAGIEIQNAEDLARLRDTDGARNFYAMFLSWRMRNEPFRFLISRFVRYWTQLDDELVYVGSRWGEETFGEDGVRKLYVRMRTKTRADLVNLAVVKIKEEQDFVDFRIMKYVEVLNALGLLNDDLYLQIKFGTSDPFLVCLLRNGFSPELARLVQTDFSNLVTADVELNSVIVFAGLPPAMIAQDSNDILVYEAQTLVNDDAVV